MVHMNMPSSMNQIRKPNDAKTQINIRYSIIDQTRVASYVGSGHADISPNGYSSHIRRQISLTLAKWPGDLMSPAEKVRSQHGEYRPKAREFSPGSSAAGQH